MDKAELECKIRKVIFDLSVKSPTGIVQGQDIIWAYQQFCDILADYFADTSCNPPKKEE